MRKTACCFLLLLSLVAFSCGTKYSKIKVNSCTKSVIYFYNDNPPSCLGITPNVKIQRCFIFRNEKDYESFKGASLFSRRSYLDIVLQPGEYCPVTVDPGKQKFIIVLNYEFSSGVSYVTGVGQVFHYEISAEPNSSYYIKITIKDKFKGGYLVKMQETLAEKEIKDYELGVMRTKK